MCRSAASEADPTFSIQMYKSRNLPNRRRRRGQIISSANIRSCTAAHYLNWIVVERCRSSVRFSEQPPRFLEPTDGRQFKPVAHTDPHGDTVANPPVEDPLYMLQPDPLDDIIEDDEDWDGWRKTQAHIQVHTSCISPCPVSATDSRDSRYNLN